MIYKKKKHGYIKNNNENLHLFAFYLIGLKEFSRIFKREAKKMEKNKRDTCSVG